MSINPNSPWYKASAAVSDERRAPSFEELIPSIEQLAYSLIVDAKATEDIHANKGLRITATNRNLRYIIIARTDQFAVIEKTIKPKDAQKEKSLSQRQQDCLAVVEAAVSLKQHIAENLERFYRLFLLADEQNILECGLAKMDEIKSKIDGLAKMQDSAPKPQQPAAKTQKTSSSPWVKKEL